MIVYYTMFLGSECNFRNVALAPVFVFFLSRQQNWLSTVAASNSRSGVESTILECFANVNLSFFLFRLIELRIGASWCFNCVMSMVLQVFQHIHNLRIVEYYREEGIRLANLHYRVAVYVW